LKNNYYNGNPEKLKKTIGTVISKKNLSVFEAPKLIVQVISQTGKYGFDSSKLYFTGGGMNHIMGLGGMRIILIYSITSKAYSIQNYLICYWSAF